MRILDPDLDLDGFWTRVREAPARVLLLDYDGTLAPFRDERDEAVPYPGAAEAVRTLLDEGHTRVVVVSGRAVGDLLPLLGLDPAPEIRGSHGWEVREPGGPTRRTELPATAERGILEAKEEASRAGVDPGRVEEKPASIAFHTRGIPGDAGSGVDARSAAESLRSAAESLRSAWERVAEARGMELHPFDGGIELRIPGRDKGTAVHEILEEEPPDAAVAYLGDDLTDEDAFEALGGREGALTALVRTELRETAAGLWLRPPDELLEFLETWRRNAWTG